MKIFIFLFSVCLIACGGGYSSSQDLSTIDVDQYSSPYGEYYLRIENIQSCSLYGQYVSAPAGTQKDFILQIVSDLSNFYKKFPEYQQDFIYLTKFSFGDTNWSEIGIKSNKRFNWSRPDSYTDQIMYSLIGQFGENWDTVNFTFSTHILDNTEYCVDRWHGAASKIREFEIPNIR